MMSGTESTPKNKKATAAKLPATAGKRKYNNNNNPTAAAAQQVVVEDAVVVDHQRGKGDDGEDEEEQRHQKAAAASTVGETLGLIQEKQNIMARTLMDFVDGFASTNAKVA